MPTPQQIIARNQYFFIGFIIFFLSGLAFLLLTSKSYSFLQLTAYHSPALDQFFVLFTNLGDGLFSIGVVVVLLLLRRYFFAWQVLAAYAISGLIAQLLKQVVFSPRPMEFFKLTAHIHVIRGVTNTGNSSFPSGHTASIFALSAIMSMVLTQKRMGIIFLFLAMLVGYSRIYLAQHFLLDVLAGSMIGVLVAIFVYVLFAQRFSGQRKP